MKISLQEKKEILSKYNDENTSNKLLIHLIRHYPIVKSPLTGFPETIKFISIDGKNKLLQGNKKNIVNKIFSLEEDNWPNIEKPTIRRTIKKYLDGYLIDTE